MPPPLSSAKPADRSEIVHHTPLKPGMTMKDLRPDAQGTAEEAQAELLKKRIAEVPRVADLPSPPKLSIVVATKKDGSYDVLYVGSDRGAADKAAEFDPSVDAVVEVFYSAVPSKRYHEARSEVIHKTPLKPNMTMKDLKGDK